jgi:hypothetical protein
MYFPMPAIYFSRYHEDSNKLVALAYDGLQNLTSAYQVLKTRNNIQKIENSEIEYRQDIISG